MSSIVLFHTVNNCFKNTAGKKREKIVRNIWADGVENVTVL